MVNNNLTIMKASYVIGIDFGTDSARALIVNADNGDGIATSVMYYPRWKEGKYCNPAKNQYRQHPKDYIEVLEFTIKDALSKCESGVAENIIGISVDTTGSTPVLTSAEGIPLSLCTGFEENPNAMFVLWKDHTAINEAEEINALSRKSQVDYTKYEGGIYSSEWVWAKVLHVLREDEELRSSALSWIEHCDWIPALLCDKLKPKEVIRSRCAAGHKALWHSDWNGLPPKEFFKNLDPVLIPLRENLYDDTFTADHCVGKLSKEWAEKLGLTTNVSVGSGAFDCHMGAVGGEISPNVLVRSIGTSTCDILISSYEEMGNKLIPGICGQVDGSVIPGYIGLEAGQSAFGDVYAWFKNLLAWPVKNILINSEVVEKETLEILEQTILDQIIEKLSIEAEKIPFEESSVLALDWMNGRRTPDANQQVKGALSGLTLGSDAPLIFRSLVEATAFGSRAIVERFNSQGVKIEEIVALGGVAKKSPFVMQTLANVLNMPIKIATTEQTCAFGAAMFAAVVGGVYEKVEDAQKAMGKGFENTYYPETEKSEKYDRLYDKYKELGSFIERFS